MSIEIRQMSIKSQVVQRAADGDAAADADAPQQQGERDWRAECRRLIGEVLDERKER
jgi:hypothetical protein